MKKCPFCNYEKHSNSFSIIATNDHAFANVSKWPFRKGHCTVITKRHITSISELTAEEFQSVGDLIGKISRALEKYHNAEKTYILSIGDKVNHFHFHLLPKLKGQKSMGVYCFEKLVEAEGENTLSDEQVECIVRDIQTLL